MHIKNLDRNVKIYLTNIISDMKRPADGMLTEFIHVGNITKDTSEGGTGNIIACINSFTSIILYYFATCKLKKFQR